MKRNISGSTAVTSGAAAAGMSQQCTVITTVTSGAALHAHGGKAGSTCSCQHTTATSSTTAAEVGAKAAASVPNATNSSMSGATANGKHADGGQAVAIAGCINTSTNQQVFVSSNNDVSGREPPAVPNATVDSTSSQTGYSAAAASTELKPNASPAAAAVPAAAPAAAQQQAHCAPQQQGKQQPNQQQQQVPCDIWQLYFDLCWDKRIAQVRRPMHYRLHLERCAMHIRQFPSRRCAMHIRQNPFSVVVYVHVSAACFLSQLRQVLPARLLLVSFLLCWTCPTVLALQEHTPLLLSYII